MRINKRLMALSCLGTDSEHGCAHLPAQEYGLEGVTTTRPERGWWDMATTHIDCPGMTDACVTRGLKLEEIKPLTGLLPGSYYLAIRSRSGGEGWLGGGGVSVRD